MAPTIRVQNPLSVKPTTVFLPCKLLVFLHALIIRRQVHVEPDTLVFSSFRSSEHHHDGTEHDVPAVRDERRGVLQRDGGGEGGVRVSHVQVGARLLLHTRYDTDDCITAPTYTVRYRRLYHAQ